MLVTLQRVADWARPVVHWEIEARDPALLREFYARLFNWEIGDGPIMTIAPGIGGPEAGPAGHLRASDTSRVNLYVQVQDVRASQRLAEELGGSTTLPPFEPPGGGPTLAGICDPEGNPLMLVQQ
jgi:predicted enzyme related to lactoylglutathione lyase